MSPADWTRRELLIGATTAAVATITVAGTPRGAVSASSGAPENVDAAVPSGWFDLVLTLVRTTPGFSPPVAARAFGYAGIALYESVVQGARDHQSLGVVLPGLNSLPGGPRHLHWEAAANAALASIVRSLLATADDSGRAAIDTLEESFVARFSSDASSSLLRRSVERGQQVAAAVFDRSLDDGGHEGYARNFPHDYAAPVGPGIGWPPRPSSSRRCNRRGATTAASPSPPGGPARPATPLRTPRTRTRTPSPRLPRCSRPSTT